MKSGAKDLLSYPAMIILAFTLYANTFASPFLFDDRASISENPVIKLQSLSQVGRIGAILKEDRPLTQLSLALNYYFHRLRLPGYHLVNICLHIGCGFLVYLLLQQILLKSRYREGRTAIAALTALLFIAHPVQAQAVTYIVQRGTSLATFFYILSLILFIYGRERKIWAYYAISLIAGCLSLASKQIAVTLPLIILLYDFYFYRDRKLSEARKVSLFYIILLALPVVLAIVYTRLDLLGWLRQQYQARPFTPYQRVLTEFRVVAHYLTTLSLPLPGRLNIDHHIPLSYSLWDPPATFFGGAALLVLLKIGWDLAKKRPVISFFIFWFFINLLLESSVLGLELIFDHRMYLPSVAFILVLVLLAFESLPAKIIWPAGALLLAFYGWGTFTRNRVWQTELALWQDAAAKSPQKPRVLYNLGHALADQGRYDLALAAYKSAVFYQPDISLYYNNLGSVYMKLGRHKEAMESYRRGLELNPDDHRLYNNIGNAYKNSGRYEDAIAAYNKSLSLKPDYYEAINNLGVVYHHQEKYDEAIRLYKQVLKERPEFAKVYLNLALAYKMQLNYHEAIKTLDRGIEMGHRDAGIFFLRGKLHSGSNSAVKTLADFRQSKDLDPDSWEIRNTLGEFYRNNGDYTNAAFELDAAVRLKPDHVTTSFNLAMVYKSLRQYGKAEKIFFSLLERTPDLISTYYNLGNMYVEMGDYPQAIKWFEKAYDMDPGSREFAHNLALARLKSGDIDGAEDDLLKITREFPDYRLASENLAFLYLRKKIPQKAVSIFLDILKKNPEQASTLNRLGMIYYKEMADYDRAIDYFRRSVSLAPDQPEVEKIKSMIAELEQ